MIEEDYISFETAKLLKEKGFDEKCKYVWKLDKANNPQDTDGISKICAEQFMEGESFVDNSDIKKVSEYEDWIEDYHKAYLCPTLQMVMKWLREVHNLYIDIRININNSLYSFKIYSVGINGARAFTEYRIKSYEGACEAAIKYCLENLI